MEVGFMTLISAYTDLFIRGKVRGKCPGQMSRYRWAYSLDKLTRSFYFQLRRLRAIRKSVSSYSFTSITGVDLLKTLEKNQN